MKKKEKKILQKKRQLKIANTYAQEIEESLDPDFLL